MDNNFLYVRVKNNKCWDKISHINYEKYNLPEKICPENDNKYIIKGNWGNVNLDKLVSEIINCAGSDVLIAAGTTDKDSNKCTYHLFLGEIEKTKSGKEKPIIYSDDHKIGKKKYLNIFDWIQKDVFKIDSEAKVMLADFGVFSGGDMPYDYYKWFVKADEISDFSPEGKAVAFTGGFKNREKLENYIEKNGGKISYKVNGKTALLVVGLHDESAIKNKKLSDAALLNESGKIIPIISEKEFETWKDNRNKPKAKPSLVDGPFMFGSYVQSTKSGATSEPIEWIVLEENKTKQLIISKYIIDVKPFDLEDVYVPIWEESYLRRWLNDEFFKTAFSPEEQQRILKSKISNVGTTFKTSGSTEDYVFLLRDADLKKYFKTTSERKAMGTDAAFSIGSKETEGKAGCFSDNSESPFGCWRLRTMGNSAANYVDQFGIKDDLLETQEPLGIRPALWIKKSL